MIIEGIATSIEDVKALNEYGAHRIELCSHMDQDGLTPDIELIKAAVDMSEIPINVMVRPHNNGFQYEVEEIHEMARQIEVIRNIGANGVVVGVLDCHSNVATEAMEFLINHAGDMDIVFHKAFDATSNQFSALETLKGIPQVKTILTSGGSGEVTRNMNQLKELIRSAKGTHIDIMLGGGLNIDNIQSILKELSTNSIHFGTGIRASNSFYKPISKEKIACIQTFI